MNRHEEPGDTSVERRSIGLRRRCAIVAIVASSLAACGASELPSGGASPTEVPTDDGASLTPTGPDLVPGPGSTTPGTAAAATTSTTVPDDPDAATTTSSSTTTTTTTTIAPLAGWDAVDAYLGATLIDGGSDAAAVAVLRDGQLVFEAAYGTRTVGGSDPATVGLRFRIASISKVVTAVTALGLVEGQVIGLDEPVVNRVAARLGVTAAADVAGITVRQLLAHRSGFPQYESLFFDNEVADCTEAAGVGLGRPLQSVPGTAFQYSNLNYCVLGLLIEEVTGTDLETATLERTLRPLGLDGLRIAGTFDRTDADVEHRSTAGRNYMETLGAAGAWIATARDVAELTDSLDPATAGPSQLGADTIGLMQTITTDPPVPTTDAATDPASVPVTDASTTTTVPPAPTRGYGLGLMIFGDEAWGHTGTIESTHAMTVRRPDGYTWAILVSGDYPTSTPRLADIMGNALLLGGFADDAFVEPPAPIDPPG